MLTRHTPKPRAARPTPIREVLDSVLQQWNSVDLVPLQLAWPQIVGRNQAANSQVKAVRAGVLQVAVANDAARRELFHLKGHILKTARQVAPGARIRGVKIRIGEMSEAKPVQRHMTPRQRRKVEVSLEDRKVAEQVFSDVTDPELREALVEWMARGRAAQAPLRDPARSEEEGT